MKASFLPCTLSALCVLMLASCVDPNYYGGSYGYHGSVSYSTLPYGYQTVHVGGIPYYYHGSRWYRHHSGRYITCPRPHGYHGSIGRNHHYHGISRLPYGYRTVTIGGHRYYHHGHDWYRKSGSRYVTCPRPSGYHHADRHKKTMTPNTGASIAPPVIKALRVQAIITMLIRPAVTTVAKPRLSTVSANHLPGPAQITGRMYVQ